MSPSANNLSPFPSHAHSLVRAGTCVLSKIVSNMYFRTVLCSLPGVELARRLPLSKGSLSFPHLFCRIHTPLIYLRIFSYALTTVNSTCSALLVFSWKTSATAVLCSPALVQADKPAISWQRVEQCRQINGEALLSAASCQSR